MLLIPPKLSSTLPFKTPRFKVLDSHFLDEWEPLISQIATKFPKLLVHIFEYMRVSLSTLFRNEISHQTRSIAARLKDQELVEQMLQQS